MYTDFFFSFASRPLLDPPSFLFKVIGCICLRVKKIRGVKLTIHFHLVPRFRKRGAVLPFHSMSPGLNRVNFTPPLFFYTSKISVFGGGWVLQQILCAVLSKYPSVSSLNLKVKEEYHFNGLVNF